MYTEGMLRALPMHAISLILDCSLKWITMYMLDIYISI